MDCLFCKIIKGEIHSKKVYEDDLVIAILDAYPNVDGHTLIIPKKHYDDFKDLDDKIIAHIFNITKKLEDIYASKLNYSAISYLWNYKDSQVIKHFHLHMLPNNNQKATIDLDTMLDILN